MMHVIPIMYDKTKTTCERNQGTIIDNKTDNTERTKTNNL